MHDAVPAASLAAGKPQPDAPDPVLPDPIRRHLGRLLAEAYGLIDLEGAATGRFTELIARLDSVYAGDEHDIEDAAFRTVLLGAVPALRRFALSLARNPSIADDLVQETLLRAWGNRASFNTGSNFEAWAMTILRNWFYTDAGKRRREVQDEDGAHAARLTSLPEQAGHLDLADMRSALVRLSAPMRQALTLVGVESLTYEEAAAVMGCEMGTVKSRVWRARAHLKRALGYGGEEIGGDGVMLSAMAEPI